MVLKLEQSACSLVDPPPILYSLRGSALFVARCSGALIILLWWRACSFNYKSRRYLEEHSLPSTPSVSNFQLSQGAPAPAASQEDILKIPTLPSAPSISNFQASQTKPRCSSFKTIEETLPSLTQTGEGSSLVLKLEQSACS